MIFNMVGKSGPSLLITDTTDANGGTIRTITGKVVKLQTKSITPTTSTQTVNPDTGYDGFSQVTVGAAAGGGINNQNKTVSPTTSQQSITYDSGYTGLGTVTVNAMPSGTTTSPTSISGSSASVTTGTNTITLSKTISVTPQVTTAGYVSAGTAGNSSVSLTASVTTKAAATITPGTSNQTIESGTYLTGTQTISGDTNLVAGNIKSGVSIFGVSGTYTGSGGGSGGSVTQDQDGYIVLPSTGGGGGGATQHVIHLEFTDSTDTDINVYYDNSLISTMITAYTPETYGQKTVDVAELDGVEWYTRPTETWETVYNNTVGFYTDTDPTAYPYCWISDLADVPILTGSQWRVTFDGVVYSLTGYPRPDDTSRGAIGNTLYLPSGTDDDSGVPFALYHTAWGAWSGSADVTPETQHSVKLERLVIT